MPAPKTEKEILDRVGSSSLRDLVGDGAALRALAGEIANMSPEELRVLLAAAPELIKALNVTISSIGEVGISLEETKRHRWSVLKAMAESGTLSGDQILEAMRLIAEIEQKEKIDWIALSGIVVTGIGAIAAVIWGAVKLIGREGGKAVIRGVSGSV